MKRRHRILARVVLAGSLAGAGARAEDEVVLPTILVESYRNSIIPAHFAGSSSVIDEETIRDSGARSVADLLAARGGLLLTSTSGNLSDGQVHLRGFGENSNLRVLVVVDGQPVNRPDMGGVSWLEVPLSQIERVEILRGSQTARFGNNAVGGVIHLVTKQGGGTPSGSLEGAGGSDGLVIVRGSYRGTFSGNDLSLDVERNDTDGWRDNSASEVDSFGLRWKREIFDAVEARIGLTYADEYGEFPGPLTKDRYLADPRQSIYALYGQADQYFSEQQTLRLESGVMIGKGKDWSFEAPVGWSRRDQSWNMGPGSHADNLLETVSLAPVLRARGETWSAEAGMNYRRDDLAIDKFAEIARRHLTGSASLGRDIFGVWSGTDWEPAKGWHLSASTRWEMAELDAASDDFTMPNDPLLNFARGNGEDHWAAQLGLRWEPRDDLAAWLRYDRIYRLPATDEIAAYQGYPMTVPFNDRLEAETGDGVELGAEFKPGNWTFGANLFAQWLDGEILYDYLQNLNVNLAGTRRYGVELNGGWRNDRWEAEVRYTSLAAEFADGPYAGNEVYLVPRNQVSAVLACHPVRKLTVQGEWQYVGSSFEGNDFRNNHERLPSYQVSNLLLRYEAKPGLTVYARVNNLFDERYATVKYSGVWYPAAGRQFQLGVRREF